MVGDLALNFEVAISGRCRSSAMCSMEVDLGCFDSG